MAKYEGAITLVKVRDGAPGTNANAYSIEFSQPEILKFVTTNDNGMTYSPKEISFTVYKTENNKKNKYELTDNDPVKIEYISGTIEEAEDFEITSTKFYDSINQKILLYTTSTNEDGSTNREELLGEYRNDEGFFKVSVIIGNETIVNVIAVRFGTTQEMATFNLYAAGFNAAIQSTKLKFSADGLNVENGGLTVSDSSGEKVFYADENGDLNIKGKIVATDGSFKGTIEATSGSFKGKIEATEGSFTGTIDAVAGTIGGFTIGKTALTSTAGNIVLNGGTGEVTVDTINLGTGAKISDYINLGNNVRLMNPDGSFSSSLKLIDSLFLSVTKNNEQTLTISQSGVIKLGQLTLDGPASEIKGNNWGISRDSAYFNNVSVAGKISSAVFEYNKTQVAAGAMIFKPSTRILSQTSASDGTLTLEIENDIGLKNDDYIWLNNSTDSKQYKIISIFDRTVIVGSIDATATVADNISETNNWESLTLLASHDDQRIISNNLLIGINAMSNSKHPLLIDKGLSFYEVLEGANGELNLGRNNPLLFLGDLASLNNSEITGYGLYGENVYLTGSLTTKVSDYSYAGVNTLSGINATIFKEEDTSRIVFWAGSKSNQVEDIQEAKFQVTEKGSIYANSGIFEGALVTKSDIYGSNIYAANIYGHDGISQAALNIYDTSNGIVFKNIDESILLTINSNGFLNKDNDKPFINLINTDGVVFNGYQANLNNIKATSSILIGENGLSLFENGIISFGRNSINLNTSIWSVDTKQLLSLNINEIGLKNTQKISLSSKIVVIGDDNQYLRYEKVDGGGFDLYVL